MAIIQIKRRTTAGTGPLTGNTGSVKIGEPLVDFTGEHLYIAKQDKTASAGNPLTANDYVAFPSTGEVDKKITALQLKGASKYDVGVTDGKIPVVGSGNKLPVAIIPDVSPVKSVNSKTGAVTITLAELSGVPLATYNAHKDDNSHLTEAQRSKINNIKTYEITPSTTISNYTDLNTFKNASIASGLNFFHEITNDYGQPRVKFYLGISKEHVYGTNAVIDGGTY